MSPRSSSRDAAPPAPAEALAPSPDLIPVQGEELTTAPSAMPPALPVSVFGTPTFTRCAVRDAWIALGEYLEVGRRATTSVESGGDLGRTDAARARAEHLLDGLTALFLAALEEVDQHKALLREVAEADARRRALTARRAENMERARQASLEPARQAALVEHFPAELLERAGKIMGCPATRDGVREALRLRQARGYDSRSDEQRTLADQVAFLVGALEGDSVLGAKTAAAVADALHRIDTRVERAAFRAAAREAAERRERVLGKLAARAADATEPGGLS